MLSNSCLDAVPTSQHIGAALEPKSKSVCVFAKKLLLGCAQGAQRLFKTASPGLLRVRCAAGASPWAHSAYFAGKAALKRAMWARASSSRPSNLALSITLMMVRGSGEKCRAASALGSTRAAVSWLTGRVVTSANRTASANIHERWACVRASKR